MKNYIIKKCKTALLCTLLMTTVSFGTLEGVTNAMTCNRNEISAANMEKLYNSKPTIIDNDKELNNIVESFIYADIQQQVKLPLAQRELLTLVVLTANNSPDEIPLHIRGALEAGAAPTQIREAIFQCTPYVGISRTRIALQKMYEAFKDNDVKLPLSNQTTVDETNRHTMGLAIQKSIFGPTIDDMNANAPADQKHINYNLSANCFGDYYTRTGLNLKERELITFTAIISLGGCEPQAKAHVNANISVGNTRQQLLDAVTIALPYIGYPRTLNALSCINSVVPIK